jgi:pteridine reductase
VTTRDTAGRDAANAAGAIRGAGGAAVVERLNPAEPVDVEAVGERLARDLPRLDVLVHNASSFQPTPWDDVDAEAALAAYRVNALAPLLLTKRLAGLLSNSPRASGGAVVAMLDVHAIGRPRKGFIAYSMSKSALHEMVRGLARELAPRVRVNGVAPGVVSWPESGPDTDPEMHARYLSRVPLAREGTPQEAAEAVRWLAMDATYVTGQVVRVDGGRWVT